MSRREGFRDPRVLIPFILITLIWSSTWIVIKDQIGGAGGIAVPSAWSVTYRFLIGAAAMLAYAAATGASLRIGRRGHLLAAPFGILQFSANFNLVYAAEHFVTSGLVATVFALLMVPNSLLAWLFLKQRMTGRFAAGSALACVGVALLFVQEMRSSPIPSSQVAAGIGLSLLAVLAASSANVMQASGRAASWPMASLIAWSMVYGTIANALFAWAWSGPPMVEPRLGYWIGLVYLGLVASALAFPLYFAVIRAVGPGPAAYSSLLIPIIAMAISTVAEGYRWTPLALAGGAVAIAGMYFALRAGRRAAAASAPPETEQARDQA
ncbi:DMT family transporter [Sphingosinicella terrae]|uniref:DMT family transporter n=1 Tax=Sphingosinicella terrae TaxID=2172047 RepID=UPI000E0DF523|nr:DMT family transporter [Sphingosinicella terrae]